MKGLSVLAIITACSLSLSFLAKAQPASAVPEIEPNESFTSKQVLPLGTSTVDGELSSTSLGGDLDFFTFSGLEVGSLFTAEITSAAFDPLLALLDDFGTILERNDDQADNNVLSVLTGRVPASGSLNFAVSGLRDRELLGDHFESGSYSLLLNTSPFPGLSTNPTLLNGGFETGDFTGWTTLGETRIETSAFGSGPTQGTSQALLSTEGATFASSIIEEFLGLEIGSLTNFGIPLDPFPPLPNGDPFPGGIATQGSAIRQTFTANAGNILTFDWNFLTNEPSLFPSLNDFSFVSISSLSDLASTTFPAVISPMTRFFQETGFQPFSFTIPTTGTYTLGIGVTDWRDTTKDSVLLVDNVQLASVPEPTSTLGLLAFGALGTGSVLKRKQRHKGEAVITRS
jgi:hypothetical protein